jgi:hypothetical protein
MPVGILAHPIPEWWLSRSRISIKTRKIYTYISLNVIALYLISNLSDNNIIGFVINSMAF